MQVAQYHSRSAARDIQSGFGLIELVITISIMAILTAIALPSFATMLRSNRVSNQANDLLGAINLARNEAITRSRSVTICAADTTGGVPSACGDGAAWKMGWMVFVDDAVGVADPIISGEDGGVLHIWVGNSKNDLIPTAAQSFIRFDPRGQAVATPSIPVEFKLKPASDCSSDQQRSIVVSSLGRSSAVKAACS
jgi:type IV fimbrial biogenesis protein FimT